MYIYLFILLLVFFCRVFIHFNFSPPVQWKLAVKCIDYAVEFVGDYEYCEYSENKDPAPQSRSLQKLVVRCVRTLKNSRGFCALSRTTRRINTIERISERKPEPGTAPPFKQPLGSIRNILSSSSINDNFMFTTLNFPRSFLHTNTFYPGLTQNVMPFAEHLPPHFNTLDNIFDFLFTS